MNIEATWELYKDLLQIFEPPPDVKISEWADTYRMLSPESSAQPGKWSTDTTPYMREIMDSVCGPLYENIVIMSSSQVGKAIHTDTLIKTTDGFKTMGTIAVGDHVFDENGDVCTVTYVSPVYLNRQCFEVRFDDGAVIFADAEHRWGLWNGDVVETVDLREGYGLPKTPFNAKRGVRVRSLKQVPSVPVRCIAVDSPSRLYLAGDKMTPTHNTEMILNIIGYYIHYDPAPMLIIQPNVDPMAKDFSTDRLAPMIRDTPVLFEKMGRGKSRTSDARMLHKAFPGGHLTIVGANSAAGLASRPIRIVLADEVDRYPLSAGNEGDPLGLALKRTTTFVGSRKHIIVSTPTEKGLSRIEAAYNEGTRERWCYSCPSCGKFQPLTWAQIRFEDVTHECQFCKERADELEWKSRPTMWLAEDPEATKARSFHINELSSPWKRWEEIIAEFRLAKAGGRDRLKVWVNTALGETFEEQGDTLDAETLLRRREAYNCELPDGVLVITAAVDVQDNRLEAEVVGWGLGKESWGIQYKTFFGDPAVLESKDPTAPSVWEQLDKFLETVFFYEDGNGLRISCTCIDSGGHHTTEVYQFCVKREHRRIFAIRGQGTEGVPLITKPSRSNRWHCALFSIGVNAAKETLFSRIKTEFVGPNYCHFPIEPEKGYDEGYFRGLVAEKRMIRYFKGQPKVEWVKPSGARNEPLDLRNYATAALEILNPNLDVLARIPREVVAKAQNNNGQQGRRRRVLSSGVG